MNDSLFRNHLQSFVTETAQYHLAHLRTHREESPGGQIAQAAGALLFYPFTKKSRANPGAAVSGVWNSCSSHRGVAGDDSRAVRQFYEYCFGYDGIVLAVDD